MSPFVPGRMPLGMTVVRLLPIVGFGLDSRRSTTAESSPSRVPKKPTNRLELLQGTLDMLVLRALLYGPLHGHAIAMHIQRTSDDMLRVDHGSLYPALYRLRKRGWITAAW